MWTHFWDMHSGGDTKEPPYEHIYIEASASDAKVIFYNRFGHNPERVTCTCCGEDYSISESSTLDQATAYQRGCAFDESTQCWIEQPDSRYSFRKYIGLENYVAQPDVLVLHESEISPAQREGSVPEQGYVVKGDANGKQA